MAFDLTDALCGDAPDRADVSELGLTAVDESISAPYDVGGTLVQGGQHVLQPGVLFCIEEDLVRPWHRLTGDQIAESGVAAFFDRCIETDVVTAITQQVEDALGLKIHFGSDLLDFGIAAESPL
jgi:hypothetical protein